MSSSGTAGRPSERTGSAPRLVALLAGAAFVALGLWAMAAPASFFEAVAAFEPYNQHLVQDIGAFQIGLGAVLLIASARVSGDGLAVALLGVGVANAAHSVSHVMGIDLGGNPPVDIPFFLLLTAVLLWAGWSRLRQLRSRPR